MGTPTTKDLALLPTKDKILILARDLLQTRGYNAFSFQDLANELHIRKASIHHHFESKEALGLALLEAYQSGFQRWSKKIEAAHLPPTAKLERYFDLFRGLVRDGEKICPGGVLSADLNTLPPQMREQLRQLQLLHREWLEQVVQQGRTEGMFDSTPPLTQQVLLIAAAVQGGLQIARVHHSPEAFHAVLAHLMLTLRPFQERKK